MSIESFSQNRLSSKQKGFCSVCKVVRSLQKNGTVHQHGPRGKPCPGSHIAPILNITPSSSSSPNQPRYEDIDIEGTFETAMDLSTIYDYPLPPPLYSSLFSDKPAITQPTFDHPRISSPIIKHIPKSVRHLCCTYLIDLLTKLYKSPDELNLWTALLQFPSTYLAKPSQAGKRHTLTSIIRTRFSGIKSFENNPADIAPQRKQHKHSSLANQISSKMEDGDVSGAIRLLCSDDKPVYDSSDVYDKLIDRHPQIDYTRRPFKDPGQTTALQVADRNVAKTIRSFPAGSAGGPDGLRPRHLLDLVNCKSAGHKLLSAITMFVNMLLEGKCHPDVIPILFGGNLTALVKKTGGVRPIAIGYTWRRVAAKCANAFATAALNDYFMPHQLGVGVSGGCEAAIHATRRFMEMMPKGHVIAKLDFSNAFNSLHRDAMLEAVYNKVPEIYKFCLLSYNHSSILRYGNWTILSQEGSQQGDPLGPLLFCVTQQPLLLSLSSELIVGYMDDITLGGSVSTVNDDVAFVRQFGENVGLTLNISKSELIASELPKESDFLSKFILVKPTNACLLGAPLFEGTSLNETLNKKLEEFSRLSVNLKTISAHDALLILRCSLSTARIQHLLRCSPCHNNEIIPKIDELLRSNICHIANVNLSDDQWMQASLPIRAGGLGIRRASSLMLSAFIASATSTVALQDLILMHTVGSTGKHFNYYCSAWSSTFGQTPPPESESSKQSAWDKPSIQADLNHLLATPNSLDKARLLAVSAPHSSDWLYALPIVSCGLRLENEDVRVAVGLRFGTALCKPHQCVCGAMVEANGLHGLSCKLGPVRHARHNAINDLLARALQRAEVPSMNEPAGLSRSDGKRPDGMTLIP